MSNFVNVPFVIAACIAYLIGSIPFAYLIAKYLKKVDLKKTGTGNPGGSNAMVSAGFWYGITGGFLDLLKGITVVLVTKALTADQNQIIVLSVFPILGHCYSIFLKGKGGRGVATALGILLLLYPQYILISLIPTIIFVSLNAKQIYKIGGLVFDSAIGVILSLTIFILISAYYHQTYPATLGIMILFIIAFRRTTEDMHDYSSKDALKHYFTRLLYDRLKYDRPPFKIKV